MIKYNVIKFCVILLLVAAFIFVPLWAGILLVLLYDGWTFFNRGFMDFWAIGFIIISVSALVLTLLFMLIINVLSNLK